MFDPVIQSGLQGGFKIEAREVTFPRQEENKVPERKGNFPG